MCTSCASRRSSPRCAALGRTTACTWATARRLFGVLSWLTMCACVRRVPQAGAAEPRHAEEGDEGDQADAGGRRLVRVAGWWCQGSGGVAAVCAHARHVRAGGRWVAVVAVPQLVNGWGADRHRYVDRVGCRTVRARSNEEWCGGIVAMHEHPQPTAPCTRHTHDVESKAPHSTNTMNPLPASRATALRALWLLWRLGRGDPAVLVGCRCARLLPPLRRR